MQPSSSVCHALAGGGKGATVVTTSHTPRAVGGGLSLARLELWCHVLVASRASGVLRIIGNTNRRHTAAPRVRERK